MFPIILSIMPGIKSTKIETEKEYLLFRAGSLMVFKDYLILKTLSKNGV
jgi:hypothetical protein